MGKGWCLRDLLSIGSKPSERNFGLPLRTLLPNNVKWLPYPQKPYILHENLHGTNYFLFFDSFSYIGLGLVRWLNLLILCLVSARSFTDAC